MYKSIRIISSFILVFVLFLSPLVVYAEEEHPLGTYIYEPYHVTDNFTGSWEIFDLPELYIESGDSDMPDDVQENMNVTTMNYIFRNAYNNSAAEGNFAFGINYGYNRVSNCTFTFYNDGNPLFENPGTLYLFVIFDGYSGNVQVTYSSGVVENLTLYDENTGDGYDSGYPTTNYVVIPNLDAGLIKIQLSGTCNPDVGWGTYLGMALSKYGYILDEVPVVPEPDTPIIVPGDTSGVITFCLSFCIQFIESLFLLEIVSGVTYGYFILACMIMSVIFGFLFSRLVR